MTYTVNDEMLDEAMSRFSAGGDETWRECMRAVLQQAMDRRDRESRMTWVNTGGTTSTSLRYDATLNTNMTTNTNVGPLTQAAMNRDASRYNKFVRAVYDEYGEDYVDPF